MDKTSLPWKEFGVAKARPKTVKAPNHLLTVGPQHWPCVAIRDRALFLYSKLCSNTAMRALIALMAAILLREAVGQSERYDQKHQQ